MKNHGLLGPARCLAVWLAATAALMALTAWLWPGLVEARAGLPALDEQPFERLLVWLCTTVALLGGAWLWAVTSLVALSAAAGRPRRALPGVPAAWRRLVLTACGVALAGSVAQPALATPGQLHQDRGGHPTAATSVRGLPLPDRPSGGHRPARATRTHVVRPGESLWSIATTQVADPTDAGAVSARWQLIYETNRAAVGADPDLILPGLRLHLPPR